MGSPLRVMILAHRLRNGSDADCNTPSWDGHQQYDYYRRHPKVARKNYSWDSEGLTRMTAELSLSRIEQVKRGWYVCLDLNPNPPMDRDGRREDSGRGEGVTGAMIRARIWVDGRLAGGLQALLGAPMAAYSGCGERDGGIGHGRRRSRTGLARVCGDVGLAGGSVADGRRQAGSGMARSRARARLNCSSQGQRRGRCRVNRRAERVIRPAKPESTDGQGWTA